MHKKQKKTINRRNKWKNNKAQPTVKDSIVFLKLDEIATLILLCTRNGNVHAAFKRIRKNIMLLMWTLFPDTRAISRPWFPVFIHPIPSISAPRQSSHTNYLVLLSAPSLLNPRYSRSTICVCRSPLTILGDALLLHPLLPHSTVSSPTPLCAVRIHYPILTIKNRWCN